MRILGNLSGEGLRLGELVVIALSPLALAAIAAEAKPFSPMSQGESVTLTTAGAGEIQPLPPASQPIVTTTLPIWQQALQHYEAGRPAMALPLWQQALQQDAKPPQQAWLYSCLSLTYQQLGRWAEAAGAIAQAQSRLAAHPAPEIQARVLNAQGRLQWSQGKAEAALRTWQAAEASYQQAGDGQGRWLAAMNGIQALRAIGFNGAAEAKLTQLSQMLRQAPQNSSNSPPSSPQVLSSSPNRSDVSEAISADLSDPNVRQVQIRTLGALLLQSGKLQAARELLQAGLPEAGLARAQGLLALGNVERSIQERAKGLGKGAEAKGTAQTALQHYEAAAVLASALSPQRPLQSQATFVQVQARLNQVALLISVDPQRALAIATPLQTQVLALPPGREAIQAQLNLASSLLKLQQNPGALLQTTLDEARALQDPVMESYALGQWGSWYEQQGQWGKAQQLTEQALGVIEPLQLAAVRYRWEWQLGRLLKQRGETAGAIASYQAAVDNLKSVRQDLLAVSTDVQFSFRDDVEPVYRELVGLLLEVPAGQQPTQAVLKQAIQQVDALQLAELENFLGCQLSQVVDLGAVTVDPTAAKVYPLILDDRLAVVVEPPGKGPLQYHEVRRSRSEVQAVLRQLRRDLASPGRTPEALEGLQTVYKWLIEPFENQWAGSGSGDARSMANPAVETFVFVLDGELRNVPMAALYDGENYLISRYAVALSPRLQLFDPRPRSASLSLLLGGIGQPQNLGDRNFPEIVHLEPELEGIRQLFSAPAPLLNDAFTTLNLSKALTNQSVSAVHLKTHGIFSSDPDETFVVTYQNLLTGKELGHLLQSRGQGQGNRTGTPSPIELLILSACSTAQGDNRAVLGMAGLAVQAGARSVVSTLWEAQDVPNTALMLKFYEALKDPKVSRAKALRSAQLSLLEQGYTTPYVWATYVLVGNWL